MCGVNIGKSNVGGNTQKPIGQRVSDAAEDAQKTIIQNETAIANLGVGGAAIGAAAAIVSPVGLGLVAGAGIGAILGGIIGKAIKLPGNAAYTIKEGDTLNDIAKKALGPKATPEQINQFVDDIAKLNSDIIKDENKIYAGDKIAIPDSGHKAGSASANISFIDD